MKKSCETCKKHMIIHQYSDHGNEYNRTVFGNIECISCHDDENELWYICSHCRHYYLTCPNCFTFCKLIGFPAEIEPDGELYHYVKNDDKYELIKLEENEYDLYDEIGYVPIPKELQSNFIDVSKWFPTGVDGSRFTKWKCENCNYTKDCVD